MRKVSKNDNYQIRIPKLVMYKKLMYVCSSNF